MQASSAELSEIPTFHVKFRISVHLGAPFQHEFRRCCISDFLSDESLFITTARWTLGSPKIANNPSNHRRGVGATMSYSLNRETTFQVHQASRPESALLGSGATRVAYPAKIGIIF